VTFGYPRRIRLKKGWEYDLIFRTGSRIKGRLVRLLFLKVSSPETRFGLAVGKRMGCSVVRNRGRRKLKEAIRHLFPIVREGYWFVVSLSSRGLDASPQEIYSEMYSLFQDNDFLSITEREDISGWGDGQ
jgi:ribonuclease P protein component